MGRSLACVKLPTPPSVSWRRIFLALCESQATEVKGHFISCKEAGKAKESEKYSVPAGSTKYVI